MTKHRAAAWFSVLVVASIGSESLAQEAALGLSTADIAESVGRATVTLRCMGEGGDAS